MQTLWPCVTIKHCLLSGIHSQGSTSPETQLNAAINDTQQKPTGGKITDSLLISAISQTWKCLFPRRPPSASTCGAATPNPVSVVNLVSFPFMLWNPLTESAGNTILQNEKKSGDKELDLKKKKNEPGTVRNKTLMPGWEESQFVVSHIQTIAMHKRVMERNVHSEKKTYIYNENGHNHYNAKVFLFTGFLELEETHWKSSESR